MLTNARGDIYKELMLFASAVDEMRLSDAEKFVCDMAKELKRYPHAKALGGEFCREVCTAVYGQNFFPPPAARKKK